MTKTLRTLGLSSLLMLGTTVGVLAATTTETTVTPAPGTVQTAPPTTQNGQMTYNGSGYSPKETTSPGNKFVTGDGRVGPAAPSAGGKLGGGAKR